MNLNEHPEVVTRPEMHYVFVEWIDRICSLCVQCSVKVGDKPTDGGHP